MQLGTPPAGSCPHVESESPCKSGDTLEDVFAEIFKDYEHGLNLIRRMDGVQQFEITEDVLGSQNVSISGSVPITFHVER